MFRFRKPKGPQPIPNKRDLLPRRTFRRELRETDKRVLGIIEYVRPGLMKDALVDLKTAKAAKAVVARLSVLMRRGDIDSNVLKALIDPWDVHTFQQVLQKAEVLAEVVRHNREHPFKPRW